MYQKHSRSPLMAGSCSQTQRVAFLGLMRGTTWMAPSSSDHSRIHSTQNTGENGGTGAQLGADRRAWEGNGLSPASAGQGRAAQSQPRSRVLDTGNTTKVSYPSRSPQVPTLDQVRGDCGLPCIFFLKFLLCHFLIFF